MKVSTVMTRVSMECGGAMGIRTKERTSALSDGGEKQMIRYIVNSKF